MEYIKELIEEIEKAAVKCPYCELGNVTAHIEKFSTDTIICPCCFTKIQLEGVTERKDK